jgi:hypothetical protein
MAAPTPHPDLTLTSGATGKSSAPFSTPLASRSI